MKATSGEFTTFVSVVESSNFGRVAEQLGQANSAVNRAVKRLGIELGVSLLNRTMRQLSLTEEGEYYFHHIQSILRGMATAEPEIMETCDTPRRPLRIDVAALVVPHSPVPLIKPSRERYPEVILSLVSSETIISLIERKAGATIHADTLTDSNLRIRSLFNNCRKIITSPDYISYYGKPETINDLKQHACLGSIEPTSLSI